MLDLNDLRNFVKVVECGGFAAAAREIDVQKSTLSRRISSLEAALGVSLIDRNSRRFCLTEFGEVFFKRCQSLVDEAERLEEFAEKNTRLFLGQSERNKPSIERNLAPAELPEPFSSSRSSRRQDLVQIFILQNIRQKHLMPGDKLPSERNLASQLGVARQAVREAVRSLEMSGVLKLERGAHGGAFIRKIGPDGIAYSLRNMLILGGLPLNDLLELRASIFGQAAHLAAERGSEEDAIRLEQNIEQLELAHRTSGQTAGIELSTAFYRILAKASQNRLLSVLVDAIADIVEEMLKQMKTWPFVREGELARRDALSAIRAGHGEEAEAIIRSHCEETNSVLLEFGRTTYEI
jgi:DNA-binding FadR family transcriptional regulator